MEALAVVIYIGPETRISQNIKEGREKVGRFDSELNRISKQLFMIMLGASLLLLLGSGNYTNPLVITFKYILLLSTIIPISLRLNLDFSKLFFSQGISADQEIGAVARNSTIPEELGRISVIFSDKTGTITANEMTFKRLSQENLKVREDDKRVFDQVRAEIETYH